MFKVAEAAQFGGSVDVAGQLTGANRASLATETSKAYELPLNGFRIHDAFGEPLKGISQADFAIVIPYDAGSIDLTAFTADREYRVVGVTSRVEVAGTDGGAVTAALKKAPSATDIASGTALLTASLDLKATVDTNQTIALATTSATLDIAAGDSIGLDFTGTLTAASGSVTVFLQKVSVDDLHISAGAFGTGCQYLSTRQLNALGSNNAYARTTFTLPPEYVEGSAVQLRFAAGMITSAASVAAAVDAEVYVSARTTLKTGSDLVTTAATTCNSTAFAEKTFDVTSAGLVVGSVLDIRVALICNSVTASSHYGAIAQAEVLLSVKG